MFGATVVLAYSGNGGLIVHVTKTGDCYHNAGCGYLRSDIEMTLEDAYLAGYRPCSRCNPPEYTGDAGDVQVQNSGNSYNNQSHVTSNNSGNNYIVTTSIPESKSPVGLILGCVVGAGVITGGTIGGVRSSKRKREELIQKVNQQKSEYEHLQQDYKIQKDNYYHKQQMYENALQDYRAQLRENDLKLEEYENKIKYYKKYYSVRSLQDIVDAPKDIEIHEDGTVIKGEVGYNRKYGDLTAFVAPSGKKYHKKSNCGSSYFMQPINIYDAKLQGYSACKTCFSNKQDDEVPYWYRKIPEALKAIKELEKDNL